MLSWTSVLSLLCVCYLVIAAYTASTLAIPRGQPKSRFIFTWLLFDALTQSVCLNFSWRLLILYVSHSRSRSFLLEGSFIWTSTFGRTANTGTTWPALLCKARDFADLTAQLILVRSQGKNTRKPTLSVWVEVACRSRAAR